MATFFGEILPIFSRAVDEEDEDDELYASQESVTRVQWTPEAQKLLTQSSEKCIQCSTLIIADGPASSAFCQVNIVGHDAVRLAEISYSLEGTQGTETENQSPSTANKACTVYRLGHVEDVLVVVCDTPVPPEHTFSFTRELFSHLPKQKTQVVVLGTSAVSNYKSEKAPEDIQPPLLRALKTSEYHGSVACPYLEQPNVITGLPAQVLTHCKVHHLAAVAYQCFVESMVFIDLDTLRVFKTALRSKSLGDICVDSQKAEEKLRHIMEARTDLNPLYT